ncbi:MAG TPA: TIGR03013 family XrtA/PEP-CTERM system glycosyltransferase [Rhizomicrobium sp.]|nr:TIGR03013 family XrtA/PEP-CTERM system glycosyltransferase [Rhizomicrobium sp.]
MRTEQDGGNVPSEIEARLVSAPDSSWASKAHFRLHGSAMGPERGPSLYRPAAPKTAENAMPASAKRFVPNSLLFLIGLDFALNGSAQALVLTDLHLRLNLSSPWHIAIVTLLSLLFTMGALYATGCYRRDSLVRFSTALSPLAVAIAIAAAATIATMHLVLWPIFPDQEVYRSVSRCFTVTLLATAIALPICSANRAVYFAMVRRHWFARRVMIVGTGTRAAYLQTLLESDTHRAHSELFFVSEAILDGHSAASPKIRQIVPCTDKSLEDLATELKADEVVVAVDEKRGLAIERLLNFKISGIPVIEYDALLERETGRIDLRWLELSWLVYSPGFEVKLLDAILKRALDLTISAALLIISMPALLVAMAAVKLEDRGPIFYRQTRVTRGGREFWIYKLRTMRVDAEAKGAQWASKNDARTTKVGSFLRQSRIDEIPQLWNVLSGEMSLVGPRPERPVFIEQLSKQIPMYNFRHGVKAGLTGWAQINYPYGASVEDARAKLEYDLYYMKNYSVLRDLSIILQTFRILIWRVGAR